MMMQQLPAATKDSSHVAQALIKLFAVSQYNNVNNITL